ncbi:FolC bifunctional protein [Pluteus cervinus]|uniref:FolC bifunctional protein n=1 Tax=Pluteus cervinus TaxID=181527 RepID=A0ACD3BFI6_9AGAR|nr:FolC bifunctional protein [Pluteus cervinus]
MATRSYADAVEHLNTLQSNAAVLDAIRASGGGRASNKAFEETVEYLERIGYSPSDLNTLNVIHITGTKGKGSTSAFTESIIRSCRPTWKTGLYTSPHLVAVRERIRINGAPIPESEFAKYFFEVWDRLQQNTKRASEETSIMPGYFRFLTILAFHAFLQLGVDATILEVGVGGTYDSTNIVPKPVATGITALGLDHVHVLGKTIPEIAWQKGGIYKKDVPALTVEQPVEGLAVLRERAAELGASEFAVVPTIPELFTTTLAGLAGAHQVQNASLAVHLAHAFFNSRQKKATEQLLPITFIQGLKNTRWPGRCQTVVDPQRDGLTWFLDGAHTLESLDCCTKWITSPGVIVQASGKTGSRVLIFNCTSGRSGSSFLAKIRDTIASQLRLHQIDESADTFFDRVIFCTNLTYADGHYKGDLTNNTISQTDLVSLNLQEQLATAWSDLIPSFPKSNTHVLPTVEHAINKVREVNQASKPLSVLVTGSLHLVGGVIEVAGLSEVAL